MLDRSHKVWEEEKEKEGGRGGVETNDRECEIQAFRYMKQERECEREREVQSPDRLEPECLKSLGLPVPIARGTVVFTETPSINIEDSNS